ncbi:DNA polymerase III subunit delta [Caenibius tardaugens NBRC 16725]|uniref:DNA-directed DNA polymerase n=1 Tax=Caenibius tardaugens NBRC 16725 TaxID=1219035 RepID=U3A1W2_9SPHN|nr:DNA polymerase III subunit delta [Caenibius tardaugens]AZI36167.1 DNA polymerase III subunit delta [Caenibius tardaugens NBRC 16725]TXH15700.1 MAG: DNA polymerase III subunit delta [Gammaproteobacteria bacterium]GAD48743.1 DNA polymerase III subunit delta [Caenibius tardaugens NBRC 16725]
MKATQRDFAASAPKAVRQCGVFFFCGQDEAGASMAADRIAAMLDDPGERVELSGAELRRDPVRLGDEARSTSLFGGNRHILIRANGDEAHDALKILLETKDAGEGAACPVLIVAGAATDKSRTAKLLEPRDDCLVAMFYPPDLAAVTSTVRQMADAAGVRLGGDLAERIARSSGLDVRLAQSEVTKLATFLDASAQAPRTADAEALDAIGAKTEEDGFMPLVNAVLSGEVSRLAGELKRMRDLSLNPVGLLLAFERRAAQLAQLAAKVGPRGDVAALLEQETRARRIFFRDKRDLAVQLRRWQGRRLERLVQRLVALHRTLMSNNQSAEILLAQELAEIARAASDKR